MLKLKKQFYRSLSLVFALSAMFSSCTPKEQEATNVVVFLTDDQGYGDIAFNGNTQIETPTLNKLAEDGIKFNNFYVSPVCAPTRASLLTGKYHYRTGTYWVSNGKENMNPEEYTMAELFKDNGYVTGAFGKWHNGAHYPFHPNRQGFDQFVGFCMGHWNNYFDTVIEENDEPVLAEGYLPDYLTSRVIEFIEQNKGNKFFCFVPYNTPHSPFQVPDKYFDKYKAKGLDDKAACVYGMVENIDDNIARVMTYLRDNDLIENTIVLFMSDNGPVPGRYNAHLRGTKGHIHEGGVKVPFVMHLPSKFNAYTKQSEIDQLAAHIDVMPTFIDLLNLEPRVGVDFDGLSWLPTLLGQTDSIANERLFFNKAPQRNPELWGGAVRYKDYRLVLKDQDTLLYKLSVDPYETNNLTTTEPELSQKLANAYFSWMQSTLDALPEFTSIPVGVDGQQKIQLPAHEAVLTGGVEFKEGHGWANDWALNFTNSNGAMVWQIKTYKAVNLGAEVLYSSTQVSMGSTIQLIVDDVVVETELTEFSPEDFVVSPDRVIRKEVAENRWGVFKLKDIVVPSSAKTISLKVIGENNDVQIKGLNLRIMN